MVSISSHVGNRAASCCIIFHPKAWLKHLFGHLGMISFIHHDSRARENSEVVINLPTYTHLYIYITVGCVHMCTCSTMQWYVAFWEKPIAWQKHPSLLILNGDRSMGCQRDSWLVVQTNHPEKDEEFVNGMEWRIMEKCLKPPTR